MKTSWITRLHHLLPEKAHIQEKKQFLTQGKTKFDDFEFSILYIYFLFVDRYVESEDIQPVLIVAGATSNSISLYQVAEEAFLQPNN